MIDIYLYTISHPYGEPGWTIAIDQRNQNDHINPRSKIISIDVRVG
jgi:hypothetical protein